MMIKMCITLPMTTTIVITLISKTGVECTCRAGAPHPNDQPTPTMMNKIKERSITATSKNPRIESISINWSNRSGY